MNPKILRAPLALIALAAALPGQATIIHITSTGDQVFTGSAHGAESVLAQVGGYGPLSSLGYKIESSPTFDGSYTGSGGTLFVTFTQTGYVFQNGSQTSYGTWTTDSGLGTYDGAVGSGTWATTLTPNGIGTHAYFSSTTFSGELGAVPEPATIAALGLGALGVLRRRSNP